jgi:hypothetical protein
LLVAVEEEVLITLPLVVEAVEVFYQVPLICYQERHIASPLVVVEAAEQVQVTAV